MKAAPARVLRADATLAVTVLVLGGFLCSTGYSLLERWRLSAARRQAPDINDLLGALAAAAGLVIVAWWVVSFTLAGAAAVLERCGRKRAAGRAARLCPAFMRRLAVAAVSVHLLSAPLAYAAEPPGGPAWVPTQEVAAQAQWVPANAPPRDAEAPIPDTPVPAVSPEWRPSAPVADPDLLAAQPARADQDVIPAAAREVTVVIGDTLWDIASRELGPTASDVDVALHWPRWYEANKTQIGENPHVLLPGQILKSPSSAWPSFHHSSAQSQGK